MIIKVIQTHKQDGTALMTAKGDPYKCIVLEDDRKINIFKFHSLFSSLQQGQDLDENYLEQNGKYWNLKDPEREQKQTQPAQRKSALETQKANNISQAQEKKHDTIAYFNSVNSAISLLAKLETIDWDDEAKIQGFITHWRDWFYSEFEKHKDKPPF